MKLALRIAALSLDLGLRVVQCRLVGHDTHWVLRGDVLGRVCRVCGKQTARTERT